MQHGHPPGVRLGPLLQHSHVDLDTKRWLVGLLRDGLLLLDESVIEIAVLTLAEGSRADGEEPRWPPSAPHGAQFERRRELLPEEQHPVVPAHEPVSSSTRPLHQRSNPRNPVGAAGHPEVQNTRVPNTMHEHYQQT